LITATGSVIVKRERRRQGKRIRPKVGPGWLLLLLFSFIAAACRPAPPVIVPPDSVERLEADASFQLSAPEGNFRFRARLYGAFPDKLRLELFDPLGRLQSIVWIDSGTAMVYVPREKIFWSGDSRVITSEVFGQELTSRELSLVLSGRWAELEVAGGWALEFDRSGLVLTGQRDGLRFEVKERYAPGPVPRIIFFVSGEYRVKIRLQAVLFNRNFNFSLLEPSIPVGTRRVEWAEIAGRWKS